jgi:hypothetical protein
LRNRVAVLEVVSFLGKFYLYRSDMGSIVPIEIQLPPVKSFEEILVIIATAGCHA